MQRVGPRPWQWNPDALRNTTHTHTHTAIDTAVQVAIHVREDWLRAARVHLSVCVSRRFSYGFHVLAVLVRVHVSAQR